MKTLHLALILLSLSGVLTQDSGWGVKYTDNLTSAVRGSSVSIPCSYYYPTSNIQVTQRLWCSMNSNTERCTAPPYVYNSASNTTSDFEYVGDDKSNCTLLIHNVQFSYSGEYRFRFITDVPNGKWTGQPGVTLQVTDSENPKDLENLDRWSVWMIVGVTAGVIVIVSVILGAAIYIRRKGSLHESGSVHTVQQKEDDSQVYANVQQTEDDHNIYANV
ncbi:uncharacterized protein Hap1MRO34_002975 isoform 2-T2 [Clarias gariepinus]|uniref:uncharacterized protein LOC128514011 isoform X2 n=1 Tax=Clarias gariepinus TaxID=13013 RepID=UPI00234CECAE|nr:uncharacterized protein LOC128514011 isoform X2 [Clarias gariepinus]